MKNLNIEQLTLNAIANDDYDELERLSALVNENASLSHDISVSTAISAQSALKALYAKRANISSDKQALNDKNTLNRERLINKFSTKYTKEVDYIVEKYAFETIDNLMSLSCYKTAERILCAVAYLIDDKSIKKEKQQNALMFSVLKSNKRILQDTLKFKTFKDSSRLNKFIKAYIFLDLVSVSNKHFRDSISKDDIITSNIA